MSRMILMMAALALAVVVPGPADATAPEPSTQAGDGVQAGEMVEWLQPSVGELPLRSEEEKQAGMQVGRELPVPEFLQPRLDAGLARFKPALAGDVTAEFTGGASDVLPGLVHAWIEAFNAYYPNVRIDIAKPYAGSLGMLEVIEGTYDFVFVSRELKPTDISSFNEKFGFDPTSIAVSGGTYRHYGFLDAIGFFVHKDNPLDRLSLEQIDRLFSSTRHRGGEAIVTWGQLGLEGEWKARPVHVYGIEPWNGFEEFVRQRALDFDGKRGEWREDVRFSHTAFPVSGQVADDPLGIGYTGLAYLARGVKMLPISTTGEVGSFQAPSYENVAMATYPLSRLVYFNLNKEPGKSLPPVLEEFVRFILSEAGQQVVLDQAVYLPLRGWQAEQGLSVLGK